MTSMLTLSLIVTLFLFCLMKKVLLYPHSIYGYEPSPYRIILYSEFVISDAGGAPCLHSAIVRGDDGDHVSGPICCEGVLISQHHIWGQ
jgi:hypothetical protein